MLTTDNVTNDMIVDGATLVPMLITVALVAARGHKEVAAMLARTVGAFALASVALVLAAAVPFELAKPAWAALTAILTIEGGRAFLGKGKGGDASGRLSRA